ncbi:hypothetical protein KQX54_015152 [Cotesia glomerata]|uniref:HAT C-terminal dimerisation domain-containing protein n=1 Tax=Cotesia glomerata TaxID=32391 RepID=A0AAV7I961_COTGL|nr:hypothetical protein KQX54_015152 [Cotesia glomerata]
MINLRWNFIHLCYLLPAKATAASASWVGIILTCTRDTHRKIFSFYKNPKVWHSRALALLRAEQQASGKKEGEVLTLIQAVSTRWNSYLDMLERVDCISRLSNDIRSEHRRRGQRSPDPRPAQALPQASSSSIWRRHEKLITLSSNRAEIPSSGSVPNELKQYLDQPLTERKSDPIEFWVNCRHFTPVLSEIALKYLICQAFSVVSERLASAVNLAVPDNRSRLTGEHIKERVLLMSIPNDYWFE